MSYHEELRALNKKHPVGEKETVVANLSGSHFEKSHQEITDMLRDLAKMKSELDRKAEIAKAKSVLFWDAVRHINEIAESANDRGLTLGVRTDEEGNMVLVSFQLEEPQFPFGLQSFFGNLPDGEE